MSAVAQEEDGEEATPNYITATYFYCSVAKEEDADKVVKEQMAPIYDAAVEAGIINSWGWMAHRNGGKWRRVLYFSATGTDAALDAAAHLYSATDEASGDDNSFNEACPSHDDYIWEASNVGGAGEGRGEVGFSTYFYCDSNREERADEIIKETFAPVLDSLVENGNLSSWGWISHYVGGKIRRALTMTAPSHKATLQGRDYVVDVVFAEGNEGGAEFGQICANHVDYMWDIEMETP
jgi:hypothetical protein